jgi:hypothetical protein
MFACLGASHPLSSFSTSLCLRTDRGQVSVSVVLQEKHHWTGAVLPRLAVDSPILQAGPARRMGTATQGDIVFFLYSFLFVSLLWVFIRETGREGEAQIRRRRRGHTAAGFQRTRRLVYGEKQKKTKQNGIPAVMLTGHQKPLPFSLRLVTPSGLHCARCTGFTKTCTGALARSHIARRSSCSDA